MGTKLTLAEIVVPMVGGAEAVNADTAGADWADFCSKCGKRIDQKRAVWLNLQSSTGRYCTEARAAHEGWLHKPDDQGAFPFGPDCAAALEAKEGGNG